MNTHARGMGRRKNMGLSYRLDEAAREARYWGAANMPTPKESDRTVKWLLVAYAVYAFLFIFKTSFVIDGIRYFSLFDDGMI